MDTHRPLFDEVERYVVRKLRHEKFMDKETGDINERAIIDDLRRQHELDGISRGELAAYVDTILDEWYDTQYTGRRL